MASYIIEPNEDKCREFLKDLPVRIVRVIVDEERSRLEVEVKSHKELDYSTKKKIKELIKCQIPQAKTINIYGWLEDSDFNGQTKQKPVRINPEIVRPATSPEKPKTYRKSRKKIWEKKVVGTPEPLSSLIEETPNITVSGQICHMELKEFKTGRSLATLDLTDLTSTYPVKIFLDQGDNLPDFVKEGNWIILNGRIEYDNFTRGLVIYPTALNETNAKERVDNAPEKRVKLHLHTKMSSLDAVNNPG
ncbi:MAG: hypothetical protein PHD88_06070, partial [Firmicutes bacterium]|nr:hypothetical protein [Bacillota bacterium]